MACQRSPACSQIPGDSISHIEPALRLLRAHPFQAHALDTAGKQQSFMANATQLAIVMFGGAPARATVREVDAAARAFAVGDQLPLLRLMAETQAGTDSRNEQQAPAAFSSGLAAAVMCQDAPQIYDMNISVAARLLARDRAIAHRKAVAPLTYAPFTIDEYRGMPLDYAFIDECVQWPTPSKTHPAGRLSVGPLTYPDVPTLVVSGDLDNMTPVADGAAAAKNFPRGRQVVLHNSLHVNALPGARSECGAAIVRAFLETLQIVDASCTEAVAELRLAPRFAKRMHELDPASALPGNAANEEQLRAVSAALLTAGDAMVRAPEVSPGNGVGLRGGTYNVTESKAGYRITLKDLHWTEDLAVSGTIDVPSYHGRAHAALQIRGEQDSTGTLEADWLEGSPHASAEV